MHPVWFFLAALGVLMAWLLIWTPLVRHTTRVAHAQWLECQRRAFPPAPASAHSAPPAVSGTARKA